MKKILFVTNMEQTASIIAGCFRKMQEAVSGNS